MNAFLMESTLNPADSDVALYIFLFLAGICLEMGAYGKAYNETLSWLRKRSGGSVSSITDLPDRTQNAVAILWDVIFMGIGLLLCRFFFLPFGVVWTLIIALFTCLHVRQVIVEQYKTPKNRTGVPGSRRGDTVQRQLEQLDTLRAAGLLTDQEYQQRRQEIRKEP